MTPTTQIAAIRQRLENATEGPWHMHHRCVDVAPDADEVCGLGWDWDQPGPPEPMRGVFSRHADAMFISHAHEDIQALLALWDTHQSALRALVADIQDRIEYMHRDTDWYRAQELEYWKRKLERLLESEQ